MPMTRIRNFISGSNNIIFFPFGLCIRPSASFSNANATAGKLSEKKFTHKIWSAFKGRGTPAIIEPPMRIRPSVTFESK